MGLPSKRRTKSSKKRRASHFALKKSALAKCPNCGKPILAHQTCRFCGYYQGKQIIKFKIKKKTTKQKAQERREKEREKKAKE